MHRIIALNLVCGLTMALVLLSLFDTFQRTSTSSFFNLEQIEQNRQNLNPFFAAMLLGLLLLSYIKRRKRTRLVLSLILGLVSYFCWFSAASVGIHEQKFIALIILVFGFWVLRRSEDLFRLLFEEKLFKNKRESALLANENLQPMD